MLIDQASHKRVLDGIEAVGSRLPVVREAGGRVLRCRLAATWNGPFIAATGRRIKPGDVLPHVLDH